MTQTFKYLQIGNMVNVQILFLIILTFFKKTPKYIVILNNCLIILTFKVIDIQGNTDNIIIDSNMKGSNQIIKISMKLKCFPPHYVTLLMKHD